MTIRISPEQYFAKTEPQIRTNYVPQYIPYQTYQTNENHPANDWIIKSFIVIGGIIILAYMTKKLFEK